MRYFWFLSCARLFVFELAGILEEYIYLLLKIRLQLIDYEDGLFLRAPNAKHPCSVVVSIAVVVEVKLSQHYRQFPAVDIHLAYSTRH